MFFLVISSFLLHFFYFVSFPRSPVARHPLAASLVLYFLFSFIGFATLVHFPISNRPVGYASGFIGATPESNLEVLRTYIHTYAACCPPLPAALPAASAASLHFASPLPSIHHLYWYWYWCCYGFTVYVRCAGITHQNSRSFPFTDGTRTHPIIDGAFVDGRRPPLPTPNWTSQPLLLQPFFPPTHHRPSRGATSSFCRWETFCGTLAPGQNRLFFLLLFFSLSWTTMSSPPSQSTTIVIC